MRLFPFLLLAASGAAGCGGIESLDVSADAGHVLRPSPGDAGVDVAVVDATVPKDATIVEAASADVCVPKTCAELGYTCGPNKDGCGGSLDCGTCVPPQFCGGGGFSQCGGNSGACGGGSCACPESIDAYCADPTHWCVRDWKSASAPGVACAATWTSYETTSSPCGGVDLVTVNLGVDGFANYVYDASSGALIAVLSGGEFVSCLAGDNSVDVNCISDGDGGCCFATMGFNCTDAGRADASPD